MKTILLNYPGRFSSGVPRLGAVTVVALLLAAGNLAGATLPAASTFSGGRAGTPRYGYVDGDTAAVAQFHTPIGLALDNSRGRLYVADRDNNAIRKLDLDLNQTITFATNGINRIRQPVGVALDGAGNLYALNRQAWRTPMALPWMVVAMFLLQSITMRWWRLLLLWSSVLSLR